jgi:hypothetical protein
MSAPPWTRIRAVWSYCNVKYIDGHLSTVPLFYKHVSFIKEKINFVNFHLIFIRKFTKIAFIFLLCVVLKIGNSRKVPTNVLDIAVASYSSDSRSWRRWHQVINFFILKFVTEIYYLWVAVPSLFIQFSDEQL